MNLVDSFLNFLKASKVDPVSIAIRDAFSAASNSYSASFDAIVPYSIRANNRAAVLQAFRNGTIAFAEAETIYSERADYDPYTEAYIDAHTAAMETLTVDFEALTSAFAALNSSDDLDRSASALYKVYCECYLNAALAYQSAAVGAVTNALEDKLIELRHAANAIITSDATAKANATMNSSKAEQFHQKGLIAKTKAEVFLSKATSVAAIVQETTKQANKNC